MRTGQISITRQKPFTTGSARPRRTGLRVNSDHDSDGRHIAEGRQNAGDKGRLKQRHDVGFNHNRIDDENHRRRDQNAERTTRRQRAGRQRSRIVVAFEFRQRDLPHRRRGGQRRAADRTKSRTATNRCHRDATAIMAEPDIGCFEKRLAKSCLSGELPHQDKQRHYGEIKGRKPPIHLALEIA